MSAASLLHRVPTVYAELGDFLTPGAGRGFDGDRVSGSKGENLSPVRLDVVEHRHKLVRGLRWWVDAVDDGDLLVAGLSMGESVVRMCAWLLGNLRHMAPEDVETLRANLSEWLGEALPVTGRMEAPTRATLPLEAMDAVVPVHVAAKALGVSVSTVKRRTPDREGGKVRLGDAAGPRCEASDLPAPWCAHCVVKR